MPAIPAIYGLLSEEAQIAYVDWNAALIERGAHILDCRLCSELVTRCAEGHHLADQEWAAWCRWHAQRGAVVTP